jgi:hypothetical protein
MLSNLVYLETQKPIKFNNIAIYQTPLNDILDYDIEKYNMLILPFLVDIDDLNIPEEILIQDINIFDILVLNEENFSMLLNSLSFFCKTNEISFDEQKRILYIGDGYIDRNNFADFSKIILETNSKQKATKEKPPKNMTEKQRDIWDKLQRGRQRALEKSQIDLADLINTCQFGGDYYIPLDDILQWTLWNITRCYKTILGKSNFRELFDIYCVTGEKKLIENHHWTDLIKVNDENMRKE